MAESKNNQDSEWITEQMNRVQNEPSDAEAFNRVLEKVKARDREPLPGDEWDD